MINGGFSGSFENFVRKVTPGNQYELVVGKGGESVISTFSSSGIVQTKGKEGEISSAFGKETRKCFNFENIIYCLYEDYYPVIYDRQYPFSRVYMNNIPFITNAYGGINCIMDHNGNYSLYMKFLDQMFFNIFENRRILGGGGSWIFSNVTNPMESQPGNYIPAGKNQDTGLGGGDPKVTEDNTDAIASAATEPGCGGGYASAKNCTSGTKAISGAGADGAVYIYVNPALMPN